MNLYNFIIPFLLTAIVVPTEFGQAYSIQKRAPNPNPNWRNYKKNLNNNNSTQTSTPIIPVSPTIAIQPKLETTTTITLLAKPQDKKSNKLSPATNRDSVADPEPAKLDESSYEIHNKNDSAKSNESEAFDKETTTATPPTSISWLAPIKSILNRFDRYTLIMVSAFFMGLILIGCCIGAAFCICRSFNKIKKDDLKNQLSTNPAYDIELTPTNKPKIYNDIDFIDSPRSPKSPKSDGDESEASSLLNKPNNNELNPNLNNSTVSNLLPSTSSSKSSLDSILKSPTTPASKKLDKTPDQTPTTPVYKSIIGSIKKSDSKKNLEDSHEETKLIEPDDADVSVSFKPNNDNEIQPKYTPSKITKNNQQLSQEKKKTSSILNLFKRTISEPNEEATKSKRESVVSLASTGFSQTPLNFSDVKYEIENIADVTKPMYSSTSRTNINGSQIISNGSSSNLNPASSFSNLYMKALMEKKDSKNASANKRHSVNANTSGIKMNPNGAGSSGTPKSGKNNDKYESSYSIHSYESEKSCY